MRGLQDLGWLQFERLCALLLEAEAGIGPEAWEGSADRGRTVRSDEPVRFGSHTLEPPVTVRCVWVRGTGEERRAPFGGLPQPPPGMRLPAGSSLLLFNGDAAELAVLPEGHVALGEAELLAAIDRHPAVRLALPSVLALREPPQPGASTLDLVAARALAEVFVPTAAYERALATLRRHHFAVLTGPPEMGKTAIARMISLGLLYDGWEAHECTRPEDVYARLEPGRPQIFVADDAFGSTEYRPDAAEVWARELDRILRATGERTWLIWTSRPAPLRAGLRRIHRERGGEHFPQPAEVHVDAAALGVDEKTLILFRHARAAGLRRTQRELVFRHGEAIVAHPHFTPERIRRFLANRLAGLDGAADLTAAIAAELAEPTAAMATSYAALEAEHRELLLAMLDCPPGPVAERDLAAALRRHASSPLPKAPAELVDRLADHFLRVVGVRVTWVHPSWRDLVVEALARDAAERRRFLSCCGVDGAALALSTAGGPAGERRRPLLREDADWDALADGLHRLCAEIEEADAVRLLAVLADTEAGPETDALAALVARRLGRRWHRTVLSVDALAAWAAVAARLAEPVEPPSAVPTWLTLEPGGAPASPAALERFADWLRLAELLSQHDPELLAGLGFPARHAGVLAAFAEAVPEDEPPLEHDLRVQALERLLRLAPEWTRQALASLAELRGDFDVPEWEPLPEPAAPVTRFPVSRVLRDLVD